MDREFKIRDFLKRIKNQIIINDSTNYKRVTVSGNHKGVSLRDEVLGSEIGTKKQFTIIGGDFILSKIDARNGAFGIIPNKLDKAIITGNFWTYSVDTNLIDTEWFFYFTHSYNFIQICIESSTGSTHRKYLDEKVFLNHKIILPEIEEQKEMVKRYKNSSEIANNLATEIQTQKQLLSQLKQSILQEAIQGKLTADWREQNPNTESASELLKRIKTEKTQLIKDKKIKKEKPLPPITEEEIPFELPEDWIWCKIGNISTSIVPNRDKPKTFTGNIPWITQTNFDDGIFKLNYKNPFIGLTKEEVKKYNARIMPKNSVVMSCVGVFDIVVVPDKDIVANQQLHCFTLYGNTEPLYLAYVIRILSRLMISKAIHTTIKYINKTKCESILVPLPPMEEQKAIVEKVEALMPKCHALGQEIKTSEANAQMLMQAVLKEAFEGKKEVVEA